jgi:hypothetical protein
MKARFTAPVLLGLAIVAAAMEIFGFTIIGWMPTPRPPWNPSVLSSNAIAYVALYVLAPCACCSATPHFAGRDAEAW